MGFSTRIVAARQFEQDLLAYLQADPFVVKAIINGTEHTHSDFVDLLRTNPSPAAKFIRFSPDGVMLLYNGEVVYYDAKTSRAIEKDAYNAYMQYADFGLTVLCFVQRRGGATYFQRIENIKLDTGEFTISRFSSEDQFPVKDGWICLSKTAAGGSGTPYREIDFSSMETFDMNKPLEKQLERLREQAVVF